MPDWGSCGNTTSWFTHSKHPLFPTEADTSMMNNKSRFNPPHVMAAAEVLSAVVVEVPVAVPVRVSVVAPADVLECPAEVELGPVVIKIATTASQVSSNACAVPKRDLHLYPPNCLSGRGSVRAPAACAGGRVV
jgi:hypothetical protein